MSSPASGFGEPVLLQESAHLRMSKERREGNENEGLVERKRKSLGKRIALALAAIAIGCAAFVIWCLFLPTTELGDMILSVVTSLGVMIYLTYKWSGKTIALVVAVVFIILFGLLLWESVRYPPILWGR
jgi:uncharacterized membrane protein